MSYVRTLVCSSGHEPKRFTTKQIKARCPICGCCEDKPNLVESGAKIVLNSML